jgi:hypothetical protein
VDGIDVIELLRYLRMVWLHEVLHDSVKFDDEGWRDRLDNLIEVDESVRTKMHSVLQKWSVDRHYGLELYVMYLRRILFSGIDDPVAVSVTMVLELASLIGKDFSLSLVSDISTMSRPVILSQRHCADEASRLLGIISGHSPDVEPLLRSLLPTLECLTINKTAH